MHVTSAESIQDWSSECRLSSTSETRNTEVFEPVYESIYKLCY